MKIKKIKNEQIWSGKIGNTVTYQLNGQQVTRTIGENNTPATVAQLNVRQKTKMVSALLGTLNNAINIGFALEANRTHTYPQNQAFKYHFKHAVKGYYPHLEIDYTQLLLSIGKLAPAPDPVVSLSEEGMTCSWDGELDPENGRWDDQLMMVAYCPELDIAEFMAGMAQRNLGKAEMRLYLIPKGYWIETYVAFISSTRQKNSNSSYTGRHFR